MILQALLYTNKNKTMIIEFSKREIADDNIPALLEKLGYSFDPTKPPSITASLPIIQELVLQKLDTAIKELFLTEEKAKVETQIETLKEVAEAQAAIKLEASKR